MSLDEAEKHFCRIALKNNLITQEALDLVVKKVTVSGVSLIEELRLQEVISSKIIDKVIKGIEDHGIAFTKSTDKPVEVDKKLDGESEHVTGLTAPSEAIEKNKLELKDDSDVEFEIEKVSVEKSEIKAKAPIQQEEVDDNEDDNPHTKIEGPGLIIAPKSNPKGLGAKLIKYLDFARENGASDFHVVSTTLPFIRKHGQIVKIGKEPISPEEAKEMLFGILSDAQVKKIKKDLGLDFCLIAPDDMRYRANIIQGSNGWSGTFRIINEHPPSFESLGVPNAVKRLTEYHQGLVLVTGAKGCGKTTTLASMLDLINSNRKEHVITVEDPIEYIHKSKLCQMTQRALGINTMSYSNALRGALREDPDIIMVGELRDLDTISASITAAETGHLVLASLHTTSAVRTVDRIIDAFPASQQGQIRVMIAESIRGVVCQQLLPRADGTGTVLAIEVLLNNISVRKNIIEGKTFQLDNVMQVSVREGMVRMDDSIYKLLQAGVITEEVAREFAREPDKLGKSMDDI